MTELILRGDLDSLDFSDVSTGETIPPVTPGEVLRLEFMEPLGLSAHALAKATGVPTNRITAILHGTRGITADTALRLGKHFKTSAEFWMNLQTAHDLEMARADAADSGAGELLKPMREDLIVGEREPEAGGMRVTSHAVKKTMQEQFALHEEHVIIKRPPVNVSVAGPSDAFTDKTIEAHATFKEAVVGKEARVVEEIGIKKDVADRTDTVRETKVGIKATTISRP